MIVNMWALISWSLATHIMNANKWKNKESDDENEKTTKIEAPILELIDSCFEWNSVQEYTNDKKNFRFKKWNEIKFVNFSEENGNLRIENNLWYWIISKSTITNDTDRLFLYIKNSLLSK